MKIDGHDEILKSGFTEKTLNNKAFSGTDFGDILKEKIQHSSDGHQRIQPRTVITPVIPVPMDPPAVQDNSLTVDRIDGLLDLLEDYQNKLANPRLSLRDLSPLISEIADEKEQLTPVLDSIAEGDTLKEILNQTLITASLEVLKFNRGDYITP